MAAVFLSLGGSARAFVPGVDGQGNWRRWNLDAPSADVPVNSVNRLTRTIRFYLPTQTANAGLEELERNSLRAGFGQWQAVPGAAIRFEEAGVIAGGDINLNDGTNLVFFAKSELVNGGHDSILNRGVALTYFRTIANNEVAEADIVLNAFQFNWFTDYSDKTNANFFIEATALHEIGHWLGLEHSPAGGATMFTRTLRGVTSEAGLADDELAAARALYPASSSPGSLQGNVTIDGAPLFGGVMTIEDSNGNLIQATVTQTNGSYVIPQLAAGNYNVRLTPLDAPGSSLNRMNTGGEIAPFYAGAATSFLPITNTPVTISGAGAQDFTAVGSAPAFRITRIIPPVVTEDDFAAQNTPAQIAPGTSGALVGVAGPALPTSGATLEVTGTGVTLGTTRFMADPFGTSPPLHAIYATIHVDGNAGPGLRSFVVRSGTDIAYANGFLEITRPVPDDNFDGLDDTFQRLYFPVFTNPEAGPNADPDKDGSPNASEYAAGTNPTSNTSVLEIERIDYTASGARVRWQSVAGKHYQLWTRDVVLGAPWQTVGGPVLADSTATEEMDPQARAERYYRVEVVP